MTLLEAIKSGRKFRRKVSTRWRDNSFDKLSGPDGRTCYEFNEVDLLAEDWVIEEEKVSFTSTQFDAACDRAFAYTFSAVDGRVYSLDFIQKLKRELKL